MKILNLSDLAAELGTNRRDRCAIYWRIGTRINEVYGHPHEGIPFADMRAICDQLSVSNSYLTTFRRFAWEVQEYADACEIIKRYGSWHQITSRYLAGYEPGAELPASKPDTVPNPVTVRVARELGISKAQAAAEVRRIMRDHPDVIAEVIVASVRFRSTAPVPAPSNVVPVTFSA